MLERETQPVQNGDSLTPAEENINTSETTIQSEGQPVAEAATDAAVDESSEEISYQLPSATEQQDDENDLVDENTVEFDNSIALMPIEEIVEKMRNLLVAEEPQRKDLEELKTQFYRALRNDIEIQKNTFLEQGGEESEFQSVESPIYTEGKELLTQLRNKRAEIFAKQEAEKEANVAKKLEIIEKIKSITENPSQEDFNKSYQEFKALQQEWTEIKLVPAAKANDLWKSYQIYVEKFYDIVRINNEFREYDFRKNLELKNDLIAAAERLDQEEDIISAFHQLQNLHQQWREIGPVAKVHRDDVWNKFKDASTVINKKHQTYFESLKERESENLEKKTTLCEKIEGIDYDQLKSSKDWNDKLQEILDIQKQWREIGYVPKKVNAKIYTRYREACDIFFKNKNDFYKNTREELDENLKKKEALCERAEALKESTDWRKTSDELIQIQKEWKAIGPVPRKYVDAIWKRFIGACDYFFEQKKVNTSSKTTEELANLDAKKAIIEKIKNLDESLSVEDGTSQLRELVNEFHAVGHVPFKQKDKIYKEFFDATDAQFSRLNVNRSDRKMESFMNNLSSMAKSDKPKNQILHERERLMRQYDRMKSELQTYQNNIGFLSISSKKGNSLLDDMNQKMKNLQSELELIAKKIDMIDKEL